MLLTYCTVSRPIFSATTSSTLLNQTFGSSPRWAASLRSCAVPSARLQLIERPAGFGNADHRNVEMTAFGQRLKGGKYFLMGEISGRPEKHQRIGRKSV